MHVKGQITRNLAHAIKARDRLKMQDPGQEFTPAFRAGAYSRF